MQPDIEGDIRFAEMAKIRQARAMSPAEKFLAGPKLFAEECKRWKQELRDENPDCDEEAIHTLLVKQLRSDREREESDRVAAYAATHPEFALAP